MKPAPLNSDTQAKKLLYSALALYSIPYSFCSGAIIHSSSFTSGFTESAADDYGSGWDVDGNYTPENLSIEFVLSAQRNVSSSTTFVSTNFSMTLWPAFKSGNPLGGKFVQKVADASSFSNAVQNLSPGFTVGSSLPGGFQFGTENYHYLAHGSARGSKTASGTNFTSKNRTFSSARDFNDGELGYIGFNFYTYEGEDTQTYYGWAAIRFDFEGAGGSGIPELTVAEWAYNDVAGASIQVGAVPEPAETATAVGLLALGAAGVHRWRKNKQAKAA